MENIADRAFQKELRITYPFYKPSGRQEDWYRRKRLVRFGPEEQEHLQY